MSRTGPGEAIGVGYRICAVDPGTRVVGVAVLELGRGLRPIALHHEALRAPARAPIAQRLEAVQVGLEAVIERLKPNALAVEEVFYGKNVHSALRIGEARGVILVTAARAGLDVVEYTPATVKQAVTGNGRATKQQVERMVCRLLELDAAPESSDAADALAIAFCHAQRVRGGISGAKSATSRRRGRRSEQRALQALVDRIEERARRGGDAST